MIMKRLAQNIQKKWPNLAYVTIKCFGTTSEQLNELYNQTGGFKLIHNNQL